jgi:hypothetical protein
MDGALVGAGSLWPFLHWISSGKGSFATQNFCRNPKREICFEPAPGEMLLPWGSGALIRSGYEFKSSEFVMKKEAIHE